jgi:hypothetical protein
MSLDLANYFDIFSVEKSVSWFQLASPIDFRRKRRKAEWLTLKKDPCSTLTSASSRYRKQKKEVNQSEGFTTKQRNCQVSVHEEWRPRRNESGLNFMMMLFVRLLVIVLQYFHSQLSGLDLWQPF